MAKAKPKVSLIDMEKEVGFSASSLSHVSRERSCEWYYSDLYPVPRSPEKHFVRELQAHRELREDADERRLSDVVGIGRQKSHSTLLIRTDHLEVYLGQQSSVGYYQSLAEIDFIGGFKISLLLTNQEAQTLSRCSQAEAPSSQTARPLPLVAELRQAVYAFLFREQPPVISLEHPIWKDTAGLFRGLSDPHGRTFAVVPSSNLFLASRSLRGESLPVAYQSLQIEPVGIDESIRVLMAIGEVGRANLRSFSCRWESKSETAGAWAASSDDDNTSAAADDENESDDDEDEDPTCFLPTLHVAKLCHLLRRCRQLAHLRLYFEEDHLRELGLEAARTNAGVRELCSVRPLSTVEVFDMGGQVLRYDGFVHWLQGQMLCHTVD